MRGSITDVELYINFFRYADEEKKEHKRTDLTMDGVAISPKKSIVTTVMPQNDRIFTPDDTDVPYATLRTPQDTLAHIIQ
jgi:hypothetical protein